MKWYTSADGDQRIYYTEEEIEQIFVHELARAGLRPTPAAPVTALERSIEVHLKADLDQYANLEPDVLGLTQFSPATRRPRRSLLTSAVDSGESAPGLVGDGGRPLPTRRHTSCCTATFSSRT